MSFDDLPLEPLSDYYGFDRGTPIDRRYIEAFLDSHSPDIRGSVLEVRDRAYTTRFAAERVSASAIVDIDATNREATLVADLAAPHSLPEAAYDCIILTQTLHLLPKPGTCLRNCHLALRSGGRLLVTAPCVSRISRGFADGDLWRFTPAGLDVLFREHWAGGFAVESFGNLRTCIGFLAGEAAEELPEAVLTHHDARFPLTVAAAAAKP